jgi:deoxyribose-phosphate aldolase
MSISERYNCEVDEIHICERLSQIRKRANKLKDKDMLQHIFSLIDLTSLNTGDTDERIKSLTQKVNEVSKRYPHLRNVSAICVYPVFVPIVKRYLTDENVKIASVAASFPSSQTFFDVKIKEVERVLEEGADEVDIVMSLGKFLSGDYDYVSREIRKVKELCASKQLKVILESGELPDYKSIKLSSFLAMEAGADFIKTSSGKLSVGASPEAVYIMCEAIKEFHKSTGKMVGIKPAGGISDASTAVIYYLIVSEVLGHEWLNSKRFRFGGSNLANNLLAEKYFA